MSTQLKNKPHDTRGLASSIGRNTFFGIVASVFQVGSRFITVPIVIAHLGIGGYGIWSIIMGVAAYMRFGNAGARSAFQKYVAEATGDGSYELASKLLSTGTASLLIFSVVGLIPICFFSSFLAKAAGVPPEFLHSTAMSISMLALTIIISNSGAAYDAIVVGGHRIDMLRKFNTILCVGETIAIVLLLHLGFGLFAMASVMAVSELVFTACCYLVCHRVVPQIHVSAKYVTKSVLGELVRFGGSYQILNALQLMYGAIVPIVILRTAGADAAGVLAVATRLVSPVLMCLYAFLNPMLSSASMVFGSRSVERMRLLLSKSFKFTFGLTFIPLAVISVFGTDLIEAWTGQNDSSFRVAIWLVSLSMLFQAFSLVGLVFYRASGRAMVDSIREIVRIVSLIPIAFLAIQFGLSGVLSGMAVAEFIGLVFMLVALTKAFESFHVKSLIPDLTRWISATVAVVAAGALALHLAPGSASSARVLATIRISAVSLAALLSVFPAVYLTGAVSSAEVRSILDVFRKETDKDAPPVLRTNGGPG